jgi:small nuclear ribonucleoprotein
MAANLATLFGRFTGQRVELQLKDGRVVRGRLVGSDEHMNVVLEDAEEQSPEMVRRLGTLIVRGSSVSSLSTPAGPKP